MTARGRTILEPREEEGGGVNPPPRPEDLSWVGEVRTRGKTPTLNHQRAGGISSRRDDAKCNVLKSNLLVVSEPARGGLC